VLLGLLLLLLLLVELGGDVGGDTNFEIQKVKRPMLHGGG
jgi:hypothetical protein